MNPLARVLTLSLLFAIVAGCGPGGGSNTVANKDLVRSFVEASNARDYERISTLVGEDFTRHCQATPGLEVRSREQFLEFLRHDTETFPDATVTIVDLVAEGDRVAFWGEYAGTQQADMGPFAATGRSMRLDIAGVFRVEDGAIAELWITWDNLAGLAQLGHVPAAGAGAMAE